MILVLNDNGRVVAIGNTYWKGFVTVFQYLNDEWVQVNDQITGTDWGDDMGGAVDISGSGEIIAVGAQGMPTPNGGNSGLAQVYEFDIDPTVLSTQSFSDDSLLIYPNPSEGVFNLKLSANGNYTAHIYDLFGKIVYFKELNIDNGEYKFSIPNLSNGVYVLKLRGDKLALSKKIAIYK